MASSGDERRMVFDIRGRRKNVVKVVYAILALLMGLSLFLLAGSGGVGSIFDSGGTVNPAGQLEDQAEKLERQLRKNPEDATLLLGLTRARISAGNALAETNPETGEIAYTLESRQQLEAASQAWSKYLKTTEEPNPGGAQLAAQALFGLAQTSRTGPEAQANLRAASRAQQIVAETRPSLGSLSTLAIYRLYAFDYEAAAQARKEAATYANTKFERENLGNELDQIGKRAREFQQLQAKAEKEAREANKNSEPGIPNPLSGGNPLAQ